MVIEKLRTSMTINLISGFLDVSITYSARYRTLHSLNGHMCNYYSTVISKPAQGQQNAEFKKRSNHSTWSRVSSIRLWFSHLILHLMSNILSFRTRSSKWTFSINVPRTRALYLCPSHMRSPCSLTDFTTSLALTVSGLSPLGICNILNCSFLSPSIFSVPR